jgi:hypothetical protein
METSLKYSKHTIYEIHNTKGNVNSGYTLKEFKEIMKEFPQFICKENTMFNDAEYIKEKYNANDRDVIGFQDFSKNVYYLHYKDEKARKNYNRELDWKYSKIYWSGFITGELIGKENYQDLKLFYDIARRLKLNLLTYNCLIDEEYLEKLRISDENKKIKLDRDEQNVINSIEDQFRWFYIPTDNLEKIYEVLNIKPEIKEGDITTIIDEIQSDRKIGIANYLGKTIIFGMNVPYIIYPDLNSYESAGEKFTDDLFSALNKLSKAFGSAQYFEYNNDDEQIASLAMSKKGKLVYAKFASEGVGQEFFGTQKKTMEVDQKSILKTAKKLGMTPEDILTGIMKQKLTIRYFDQPHWYIESRLKMQG